MQKIRSGEINIKGDRMQQFPAFPTQNSPRTDPNPPGSPEGLKKGFLLPDKRGDGGDGDEHDSISSESSFSICDTDKPRCVNDNACRSFKFKDDKSLKIPPHADHLTSYRAFI